ncbi:MAG: DUF4115 domain-containing protein [Acidobacteriia bacterium]|nr:DUF4115 domain-containing protein [Terriglobia bacterium]
MAYDYFGPRAGGDRAARGVTVGAFGDKFRKERERRGYTLDDVSNVTKIGSRMLKAIEDERFDQLPGGIFNKGFIRAYARHLGLNDEEAVTEYLSALRQAQLDAQNASTPAPAIPPRAGKEGRPTRFKAAADARPAVTAPAAEPNAQELPDLQLPKAEHIRPRRPVAGADRALSPWRVPALVVLMILVGVFWWNRHSRSARAGGDSPAHALAGDSSLAQPPSVTAAPSSAVQPTPGSSAAPVSAPATPPSDPAEENDVTTRSPRPLHPASTKPEPAPALTLVIRAAENSWISVIADGQQVTQETLIAPAHTSVRAGREIVVKTGNAAGVSFLLNGKEFPPQGNEAEVKTFVFDAQGMNLAPPGQTSDPAR